MSLADSDRQDVNLRHAVTSPSVGKKTSDWLSAPVLLGMLRISDLMLIIIAGAAAYVTRFGTLAIEPLAVYANLCALLLAANVFQYFKIYEFNILSQVFNQSRRILAGWTVVMLMLLAIGFMTKTSWEASRIWIGTWYLYGVVLLVGSRFLLKWQIRRWRKHGYLNRNLVVVGAGENGQRFVEHLRRNESDSGVRLLGLFDDRKGRVPDYIGGYPVLGTIDELLYFARERQIHQIVIALPWDAETRLLSWIKKLKSLPVDIKLCPDMIGFHLPDRRISHIGGIPMLNVLDKPLSGWDFVVKELEDKFLSSVILLLIAPLMLAIAAAVKLDSKGPVFFKQKRYGLNNEVINVLKFRSMYVETGQDGSNVQQAQKKDPRITRVGEFIRKTSLDELPQFINVLMGEMSIVGPRPHAVSHNEQYARLIDEYVARHRVKPGITGWAQVNGLRGETDTIEKMEQRVRHDLYYIENWSLFFDVRIIFKTLFVGFVNENAY